MDRRYAKTDDQAHDVVLDVLRQVPLTEIQIVIATRSALHGFSAQQLVEHFNSAPQPGLAPEEAQRVIEIMTEIKRSELET